MSQRPLVGLKGNKIFPRTLGNIRSRNHRLRVFYTRAPVRSSSPSYRRGKRGPERGGYLLHVVTIDLPSLQSCKTGLVCVLSRYLRGKRASPIFLVVPVQLSFLGLNNHNDSFSQSFPLSLFFSCENWICHSFKSHLKIRVGYTINIC